MFLAVLGALGGGTAFLVAITVVVKAIFRQVKATEDNTQALNDLKDTVIKLDTVVDDHTVRIVRIEERLKIGKLP